MREWERTTHLRLRARAPLIASAAIMLTVMSRPAVAVDEVHDEIQVYNAEIAELGQWTYEQHLNYAAVGQTQPVVPGGFYSNHSLQGTPEFAYGLTEWWEPGLYLPFAITGNGEVLSDGFKIRNLFVVPDAAKRNFFYGINFELGYELPDFSPTPWNLEIRPIIGVRNSQWEFIANPIVDVGFGPGGQADFAPALRLARNLGEDRFIALEYYADFGQIGDFLPLAQQNQQLYAVTDFKVHTLERRTRRRLRLHPGIGPPRVQGHYRLRVSSSRQECRQRQFDDAIGHGDTVPRVAAADHHEVTVICDTRPLLQAVT